MEILLSMKWMRIFILFHVLWMNITYCYNETGFSINSNVFLMSSENHFSYINRWNWGKLCYKTSFKSLNFSHFTYPNHTMSHLQILFFVTHQLTTQLDLPKFSWKQRNGNHPELWKNMLHIIIYINFFSILGKNIKKTFLRLIK